MPVATYTVTGKLGKISSATTAPEDPLAAAQRCEATFLSWESPRSLPSTPVRVASPRWPEMGRFAPSDNPRKPPRPNQSWIEYKEP